MRVPVPEDVEASSISVAGAKDYHYGQADVNVEHVDHARDVRVAEDEDGRYVGPQSQVAAAVADYLGVDVPQQDTDAEGQDTTSHADDGAQDTVSHADLVDQGVCPWCDDYEGDHVGQHASSAHPDEWESYKEADS